jgi:hypothetical protein
VHTVRSDNMDPVLSVITAINVHGLHVLHSMASIVVSIQDNRCRRIPKPNPLKPVRRLIFGMGLMVTFAHGAQMSVNGSSVVLIRVPGKLVIAADSKEVFNEDVRHPITKCKIIEVVGQGDGTFFAYALLSEEKTTRFNVRNLAEEAVKRSRNLADTARRFDELAAPGLKKIIEKVRPLHERFFQEHYAGGSILEVAFAAVKDGKIDTFCLRYDLSLDWKLTLNSVHWPPDFRERSIILFGENEFNQQYARETVQFIEELDLPTAARKLVQIAIDHDPDWVGPPIDVLLIDNSGPQWIGRDPNSKCQDMKVK